MRHNAITYFTDMFLCPLLVAGLAIFASTHFAKFALVEWGFVVIVGIVLWTLVEYAMHRFIYHRVDLFKRYHEVHHASPQAYVGAPPGVGTALIFLLSFAPLVELAPVLANGLTCGILSGYTIYMWVHHACHFWTPASGGYLYRVRLQHAVHHYRDDGGNFGVTTAFWDRVFATRVGRAVDLSLAT
jgi:sterol desaturase/sphingolipid hydroxylase (fatty acid hydroxylase superfamily)